MEEDLILTTEEAVLDAQEIDEGLVSSVSQVHASSVEETVNIVAVEPVEEITIEVSESIGWAGSSSTRHWSLSGRDEANQHPISSITGLKDELDRIKSLKTVESDKNGFANYYEWESGTPDIYGYFVSLVPSSDKIKICEGNDIFGVTVENAGFVGGQNSVPRGANCGLVVTSGLVDVLCETDVSAGDYVVSSSRGIAQKTTSGCGYSVISTELKSGTPYAVISLGVQACVTDTIGRNVQSLSRRLGTAETNIVSAINVANTAHNTALAAQESARASAEVSEEAIANALEALGSAEQAIVIAGGISASATAVAEEARATARNAVTHAQTLKTEAVDRANDAWAAAESVAREFRSLTAKIDQYSVGEYSQAYGLTLEQAHGILEPGMIYVPTNEHSESYAYGEGSSYDREFSAGYLYTWGDVSNPDVGIGWATVCESPSVYFSGTEPDVDDRLEYWYTNSISVTDLEGNTGTYESYTLYKWEEDHWLAVATLSGNASNRAVSEIYQTTNQITTSLSNAIGGFTSLDERLSDIDSRINLTTSWPTEEGKEYLSIAALSSSADEGSITLAVRKTDGSIEELGGASVVLGASEDDDSYIAFDAENINFDTSSFTVRDRSQQTLLSVGDYGVSIGNFTVGATEDRSCLYTENKLAYSDENEGVYLGTDGIGLGQGKFYVSSSGSLHAEDGDIAGFTFDETSMKNEKESYDDESDGVYLGTDGIGLGSGKFYVTSSGSLHAEDGNIAGFTFDATSMKNGKTSYNETTNDGVYIGIDGIGLGKGKFYVDNTGSLYATSGRIGFIGVTDTVLSKSSGDISFNEQILNLFELRESSLAFSGFDGYVKYGASTYNAIKKTSIEPGEIILRHQVDDAASSSESAYGSTVKITRNGIVFTYKTGGNPEKKAEIKYEGSQWVFENITVK